MDTMNQDPTVTTKQRADGIWLHAINGITRAAMSNSQEGALKAGRKHVHNNWHRSTSYPFEAGSMSTCDKCKETA